MTPESARAEAIDRAVARGRERLDGAEADDVARFVRRYYEHAGPEDVLRPDPSDIWGAALAHYRFGQTRAPGTAAVRVYTPRAADDGWRSSHTAVEVVVDDMPFVVDSVRMELTRHDLGIHRLLHPIVDGVSYVHVEVDRQGDAAVEAEITRDVLRVLGDVRAAVDDWRPMVRAMRTVADQLAGDPPPAAVVGADDDELAEIEAFLRWLVDDNFTFLGYREYDLVADDSGEDSLVPVAGTGLGILRPVEDTPESNVVSGGFAKLPPAVRRLAREPVVLNLTKANTMATVHRPSHLDYVGIKRFDAAGRVVGERRFLGLYTQGLYQAHPSDIPLLRRKVQRVLDRADLPPGGHAEKDLTAILATYPRDELVQVDEDDLHAIALGILHLQERKEVRLFVRREKWARFFSCLVFLPRDRYNTTTRVEMQKVLLAALHGQHIEHEARVSESVLARLHFVVHVDPFDTPDIELSGGPAGAVDLQERLAGVVRGWSDDLHDCLVDEHGEERGLALFRRYGEAFGAGYQADVPAQVAVDDIERLEALGDDDVAVHLVRPLESTPQAARFKLYRSGAPLLVSDVLPLLEHLGARVADQRPHRVRPAAGPDGTTAERWIYDFGLVCDGLADLGAIGHVFEDAFLRVWRGDMEDDGFNRLVLLGRLPWRPISVLRAYARYLRQAGTTFSPDYVESAVTAHPDIAARIYALFEARFSPEPPAATTSGDDRERLVADLVDWIETALDGVTSLDQDRILRSLLTLVRATLRTNAFQVDADGQPKRHLAIKLDPHQIPDLPLPRPRFEIWVYSPTVEGVHLRGGPVARGGLRWSDRREDFRTEVLGLMKAQMVKNAVIVPTGAKGGFVVKQPPAAPPGGTVDRAAMAAEVERCYRTFVSGLLDLTDNRRGDEIVPPPRVVRYDGDDPYLVVAADKGTATFSDVANEVAAGYGFWLGDAFASGGSAGYDHKKMGITARGAWESVKRHFRELGVDVATQPTTVVGIGDMAGDVFGNGMLLSRQLKLVAAFNHLHVFLDPAPDPETSFVERERLFRTPGSTWADYDPGLLSPGGGVFERSAKSIALTPEVRAALGLTDDVTALPPTEMVKAILRAPVDLLFNGGIGTYVKAKAETHAEVGDKANDALRVDAPEVRARVVAEGGNLGLTQRARIELARAGVRVNTDAIDNSAGVDCSDHEVNIKILLDPLVAEGDLTPKQRTALLAEMTTDVADLVLADNERQTQALTNALAQAVSLVDVHARYTRWLEREGGLDRNLEFLPSEEEYVERKAHGEGLTSPEFAVLLAYTKHTIQRSLLDSDVPDDPYLARELVGYFPLALRSQFVDEIARHRLRREIVATVVASEMVDQQGITYAYRLADETGAAADDTARAFVVARDVFDLAGLWDEVQALDNVVPAAAQTRVLMEGRKLVERATRWLLRHGGSPLDMTATVDRLAGGVAEVAKALPRALSAGARSDNRTHASSLTDTGIPPALADRVAAFDELFSALDIVEVARAGDHPVAPVTATYFAVEERLRMRWLRDRINELPRDNRWQTLARLALRDDLYGQLREVTAQVLAAGDVDAWFAGHASVVERCGQVLGDIRAAGTFDLATLSVALRETDALVD